MGKEDITQVSLLDKQEISTWIEINDQSAIEVGILGLPIFQFSKIPKDKDGYLRKITHTLVDDKGSQRYLEIMAMPEYGIPNAFDYEVFMGLCYLYTQKYNSLIFTNDDVIPPNNHFIEFTTKKFATNILGREYYNGQLRQKIVRSLKSLASVKLNGATISSNNNKTTKTEISMGLITTYAIQSSETIAKNLTGSTNGDANLVRLNDTVFKNLFAVGLIPLNHKKMRLMPDSLTRRLYSLLELWIPEDSDEIFIEYNTLIERLPLPNKKSTLKEQYRRIRKCADNLIEMSYLEKYNTTRGNQKGINFIRLKGRKIINFGIESRKKG